MDKQTIIDGLKAGDPNVLVHLYKSTLPHFSAYLEKNGGSQADADIFVWEGVEKLRQRSHKPGFSMDGSPRAYLYIMCRNMWVDHNKKAHKRHETVFTQLERESSTQLDALLKVAEDEKQRADLLMEAARLKVIIREILGQLPESCQTILRLLYFLNCKYDEICERLWIKPSAARKRAFDCRDKLRRSILDSPHLDDLMDYFNFIRP